MDFIKKAGKKAGNVLGKVSQANPITMAQSAGTNVALNIGAKGVNRITG